MKKLIKWLKWIDKNLIKIFISLFIFLSPLYPKLRISNVNYTYISIRMEDFFIAVLLIVFLIQFIRKKVQIDPKYLLLFIAFWVAGFISVAIGHLILKTIVIRHLGILHMLRRVEYMSIFFIAWSSIKNKKDFFYYLSLILLTVLIANIYGVGQKFLGWPAVQTMNPEYSKGYLLFLTPEARISSTFGGHYDLAAWTVFLMPIILGFYFFRQKIPYLLLFIFSIFILILTASRASFGAYLATIFPMLICFKKPKTLIIILAFTLLFTFTSKNLTSRISRTFQVKQIFINQETGQVVIPQTISSKEVPAGSLYLQINKPVNYDPATIANDQGLANSKILEDLRNEASKEGRILTKLEEDILLASISATLRPISTIVSDISFATRIQIEWPRAIHAFLKHPIFGVGPSALTEATDSDYLRWLGEFGLVGTLLFIYILITIFKELLIFAKKTKQSERYLYATFLFGFVSLLITATYFDIFEASKVAFQFWMMTGIFIGYSKLKKI